MVKLKRPEVPLPLAMERLPLTPNGYRKPWFVKGDDLRVTNPEKYIQCMTGHRCWICGNANKKEKVFITDIQSALTGNSVEPPGHMDCTIYALKVCPYLLLPKTKRRSAALEVYVEEDSPALNEKNPGIFVMTSVKKFKFEKIPGNERYKWARWEEKNILSQSLWSEGATLDTNSKGKLDHALLIGHL